MILNDKKLTPKQWGKLALEDALNKMIDLPFGYQSDEGKAYEEASPKEQKEAIRQLYKYANRVLKSLKVDYQYNFDKLKF